MLPGWSFCLMNRSIAESVAIHVQVHPEKPAIIAGKQIVSYQQLWQKTLAAVARLKALDVRPQDRVVLSASASPSFVYGYLAVHLLQAVAVVVDSQSTESRLKYIIGQARPKAAFLSGRFNPESIMPVFSIKTFEDLPPGTGSVEFPSLDEAADILYTTGTTGEPKGVVLTHKTISRTAHNINVFIGNGAADREVIPLPLSHSFGLGRLRCNLLSGATVILVNGFAFIGNIFRAIERFGATGFSTVPAGIAMLFRTAEDKIGAYADQMKYMEIGSAPMPLAHKKKLMKLLPNTRICMHYGLTEASRTTFIEFHSAGDKLEKSIGMPSPNVKIKIVDGHYQELPSGQIGRILVKGENVMREYFENQSMTREVFNADWLYTGDYGFCDEDGYFYLEAREKEMINVGGLKVSPVEIENLLKKYRGIEDCACVGISDPKGISGEVPKAFVVCNKNCTNKPNEIELTDFLRDKLESYKLPVEFEWIDSIPKTTSGKIQRLSLKLSQRAEQSN
jgi:long-chain acyl-CoA synthetase